MTTVEEEFKEFMKLWDHGQKWADALKSALNNDNYELFMINYMELNPKAIIPLTRNIYKMRKLKSKFKIYDDSKRAFKRHNNFNTYDDFKRFLFLDWRLDFLDHVVEYYTLCHAMKCRSNLHILCNLPIKELTKYKEFHFGGTNIICNLSKEQYEYFISATKRWEKDCIICNVSFYASYGINRCKYDHYVCNECGFIDKCLLCNNNNRYEIKNL